MYEILKHRVFVALFAFLTAAFLIGAVLLVRHTTPHSMAEVTCKRSSSKRACLTNNVESIVMQSGVPAAFEYVRINATAPGDYATEHGLMHMIGHHAFERTNELKASLAFLPADWYQRTDSFLFYHGYVHGVFQQYFVKKIGSISTRQLMHDVCGQYMDIVSIAALSENKKFIVPECFHAIGHAVMAISENKVSSALEKCDLLPHKWMQGFCYHGVFMENFYLYYPETAAAAPHPDAQANSQLPLCASLAQKYAHECHQYVSWVYLINHPGDYEGMFAECRQLTPRADENICAARSGRLVITPLVAPDIKAALHICHRAGALESACLDGVAIGVHQGMAGQALTQTDVCGQIQPPFRIRCRSILGRSEDSLARFNASEI